MARKPVPRERPAVMDSARALLPPAFIPPAPRSLEDLDVPESLLLDLAVRHVYIHGICTIHMLAGLMKLPIDLTEGIFRKLTDQQAFEVRRMSGDDYVFSLGPAGRRLALERAHSMRYAGPAPVSLRSYTAMVRAQLPRVSVNRAKLREAFSDIVLSDGILDALGPALISQRSIFLYGPSGTGKTTISERLMRVFEDTILVPWAVEADGQIITVADPAVHQAVNPPIAGEDSGDPRWMICQRPFLAVGGELVAPMLDLQKDESSGAFLAPLQMKANNGILLIDDFGRQMMSPRDLLNRWIVPLDRRVDFLSLGSGGKLEVPFELMVVFSTNLEPHELADDAFLRRIPNKILIEAVPAEAFDRIFHQAAAAARMDCAPDLAAYCRELCLRHSPDLRPCFPRDLFGAMLAITLYEGRPSAVTRPDLERAVARYFV